MIYAIYYISSGDIERIVDCPEFLLERIPIKDGQKGLVLDRQIAGSDHYIKDGVLTPKQQSMPDVSDKS